MEAQFVPNRIVDTLFLYAWSIRKAPVIIYVVYIKKDWNCFVLTYHIDTIGWTISVISNLLNIRIYLIFWEYSSIPVKHGHKSFVPAFDSLSFVKNTQTMNRSSIVLTSFVTVSYRIQCRTYIHESMIIPSNERISKNFTHVHLELDFNKINGAR